MSEATVLIEPTHKHATWKSLADTALIGLRRTYDESTSLPHTRRWDGHVARCEGRNIRYALISLLGLAKGSNVVGVQDELVRSLWTRIHAAGAARAVSIGDMGLGLWARSLCGDGLEQFSAQSALRRFDADPLACDSVQRAWLLLGADHAIRFGLSDPHAEELAARAKNALLELFNDRTSLFYRHARRGLSASVSRRVACFANQIYPLMALSEHARRTQCPEANRVAATLADKLCRAQGKRGQWWWLYDASDGDVVDGYPVYSVHQDGMAPIGLLMASAVLDRDFTEPIERSLRWLFGQNEMGRPMVLSEQGLVLRDVHRSGVGRVRRMITGTLWCAGRRPQERGDNGTGRFRINAECRPYHLAWVLYAAGLITTASGSTVGQNLGDQAG